MLLVCSLLHPIKSFKEELHNVFNMAAALPGVGALKCSNETDASGNSNTCFISSPEKSGLLNLEFKLKSALRPQTHRCLANAAQHRNG